MTAEKPLVSIIVRTKDRPALLKNALRSIASQTYRPLEAVVVNDGGVELDAGDLAAILGNTSLQYIRLEDNTGRAHAGNIGRENAHGKYIGFLDDDDEFYPEHVETLVSFLDQNKYDIAYTAVECVEKKYGSCTGADSAETLKFCYAKDFSYTELLAGNYIPLISVLFRSDIVKTEVFDESFELYEDWDMLLGAAEKHRFYFINKVTAKYVQWGDSQIAFQSSPEAMEQTVTRIYSKHWANISAEFLAKISQDTARKAADLAEKEASIKKLEGMLAEQDERISQLTSALAEREAALSAIHKSRGWRALSAYYKVRDKLVG